MGVRRRLRFQPACVGWDVLPGIARAAQRRARARDPRGCVATAPRRARRARLREFVRQHARRGRVSSVGRGDRPRARVGSRQPGSRRRRPPRGRRRRGSLPPTLDRTYWTAYEYGRDLGRLQASGYRVTLERVSTPYPDLTPNVTPAGPRRVRAQVRRASRYRVSYERLAYSTWASALPVAPES